MENIAGAKVGVWGRLWRGALEMLSLGKQGWGEKDGLKVYAVDIIEKVDMYVDEKAKVLRCEFFFRSFQVYVPREYVGSKNPPILTRRWSITTRRLSTKSSNQPIRLISQWGASLRFDALELHFCLRNRDRQKEFGPTWLKGPGPSP